MANVVTDPKARPQVVIPDFSKPDPLLSFKLDDVALVYGTKWKQRYFKKVGNDYFPLPAQWDVSHKLGVHISSSRIRIGGCGFILPTI
jgi:hypothetical protein